jgi:hypothetical protein
LRCSIAVAVAVLAPVTSLATKSEQQGLHQSSTTGSMSSLTSREQKNPFGKLFQPRPQELRQLKGTQPSEPSPQPSMPSGSHEPQIDCKIRAILADPSIDRGIRRVNPSPDVKLALRILEHPCLKP